MVKTRRRVSGCPVRLCFAVLGMVVLTGCGRENPADNTPYPSLATVPDRPRPIQEEQRRAIMDALQADRERAEAISASVMTRSETPANRNDGSSAEKPQKAVNE